MSNLDTTDPASVIQEALEASHDYLGPDPNDMDGEKWGPDPRPLAALDSLVAEIAGLRAERDEARETASKLNRRATQAEAVVMQTVEDCKRQGVSVGRSLANSASNHLAAEAERLRAERDEARGHVVAVISELDSVEHSLTSAEGDLAHPWVEGEPFAGCHVCWRLDLASAGLCTVLFNAFLIDKKTTMTMRGGNSDDLYRGDGRLRMARDLERNWPGVVTVDRRWQRPQHVVKGSWRGFDTPLRLRPGIDLDALPANEYGMTLTEKKPVRSSELREIADSYPGGKT